MVYKRIKQISVDLKEKFLEDDVSLLIYRANIKQFFRSMYLHMEAKNRYQRVRDQIGDGMNTINQSYYNL